MSGPKGPAAAAAATAEPSAAAAAAAAEAEAPPGHRRGVVPWRWSCLSRGQRAHCRPEEAQKEAEREREKAAAAAGGDEAAAAAADDDAAAAAAAGGKKGKPVKESRCCREDEGRAGERQRPEEEVSWGRQVHGNGTATCCCCCCWGLCRRSVSKISVALPWKHSTGPQCPSSTMILYIPHCQSPCLLPLYG